MDLVTLNVNKILIVVFFLLVVLTTIFFDKTMCLRILHMVQVFHGIKGLILLGLIYILSNIFLLPLGLPINLLAGMLWGTIAGGLLINFLATLVAGISFYLGRRFGDYFLPGIFKKYTVLNQLKATINRYDWQFISLARINPIVPFGLSNYLFGTIPELSFRQYIIVTAISNLLPCLVFASIGSVLNTYILTDHNIYSLLLQAGIALLLISLLFVFKVWGRYEST